MEANSSETNAAPAFRAGQPVKRLFFDRRYGWVFDEWKDPSEEALDGGRGMFCIFPIGKSLVSVISQSVSFAAESVARAVKSPEQFSPLELQANMCSHFHKLGCNVQRQSLTLMNSGRDSPMNTGQNTMQPKEDPAN